MQTLQAKSTGPLGMTTCNTSNAVHRVLRSPGQPLDPATQAFFELRFGRDFSEVRVHTDPDAAASARAIRAHAYTVESDLVFGEGRYAPATYTGRQLLAHELTHVLQQRGAAPVLRRLSDAKTAACDSSQTSLIAAALSKAQSNIATVIPQLASDPLIH